MNLPFLLPAAQEPLPPSAPRYREAFERTRHEIDAVPDARLVHINVDVMDLVGLVRVAAARALPFKARAAAVLLDFDVTYFDVLETRALALGHAHARYLAACEDKREIPQLSRRAREIRGTLRADIVRLIGHGLVPEGALGRLSRTRSHKAAGFDLLALVQIFRAHWHVVEGRTAVSADDLTDAERLGEQLIHKVATRKEARAAIVAAAHTRLQAFALLVEAYGQVRRAIRYLRYDEGDADKITPSPYRGRAKGKRKDGGRGKANGADATSTAGPS
jgi:hypothetical protein